MTTSIENKREKDEAQQIAAGPQTQKVAPPANSNRRHVTAGSREERRSKESIPSVAGGSCNK